MFQFQLYFKKARLGENRKNNSLQEKTGKTDSMPIAKIRSCKTQKNYQSEKLLNSRKNLVPNGIVTLKLSFMRGRCSHMKCFVLISIITQLKVACNDLKIYYVYHPICLSFVTVKFGPFVRMSIRILIIC